MKTLEAPFQRPKQEKTDSAPEKEYNFNEIKELEKPIENLIKELKEAIDKGEYDALIGDDTSGRIPTLILKGIIGKRYESLNPGAGPKEKRESLKTFFVVGGGGSELNTGLVDFFKKIKPDIKKKALFVTEYMSYGSSIINIGRFLEEAGIPFDVASVVAKGSREEYLADWAREFKGPNDHRLFIDDMGGYHGVPKIWGRWNLAGVQKNRGEVHAEPNITAGETAKAREDVKLMAGRILDSVWGKK